MGNKRKACIEIESCSKCPLFSTEPYPVPDSWERADFWYCNKNEKREIAAYVEWHDVDGIEIPEWCELLIKE